MLSRPFRFVAILAMAAACLPAAAAAQDRYRELDNDPRYDRRDYDYERRDDRMSDERVPYAGADLAYDYLTGEYYRYEGPRQQDPRAREQTGYRDGVLHTRPNHGYYAGVRWIGGRKYRGCGCSAWYGRYRYRPAYYSSYEPYRRENGYYERYASSNNYNWGYRDRRRGFRFYNYGY